MAEDGSKFIDFSEVDPVVKHALSDIERGKRNFLNYRDAYKKLRSAMDKTFDMDHITIGDNSTKPNSYRSALGRIQTEVACKSVSEPVVEIKPLVELPELESLESLTEEQIEDMEKGAMAKALYDWAVREGKKEGVSKRGREHWFGFGDNFSRPYYRKTKKGRKMMQFENLRPDLVITDPNGELVDSDTFATDYQFIYFVTILTREMVKSMYGEEILQYIKPDGKVFSSTQFLETQEHGAEYYLLFSGQNKSEEFDVELLGEGLFPVRRYSDKKFKTPERTVSPDKLVEDLKLDHIDRYIYIDSYGNPYLNVVQRHCFKKENSPTNYGMQQKVYSLQATHEAVENGKIDNFRRGLEEIIYVTNIRENQLKLAFDRYKHEKALDIRAMLPIPPTYGQQAPSVGAIEFPQINPVTAQQITQDIIRLARNTNGIDPDRLEIQKTEGLGVREMLLEERNETIMKIVEDNIIAIEKDAEKTINFIIVHDGLDLDNVYIQYEGIDTSPVEGVRFKRKKSKSIVDIAKELKEWNYHVVVSVDNMVKKSNAILVERIFSMLERLDPNAFPDLYKKVIQKLNEILQLNISTQDLVQQAPAEATGGALQFRSRPQAGAGNIQDAGGLQGQNAPLQAGASAEGFAGVGVLGQPA